MDNKVESKMQIHVTPGAKIAKSFGSFEMAIGYKEIEKSLLLKSADCLHLHFINGFLNYPTLLMKE